MSSKISDLLAQDIRFIEGMQACMNCGICTAVCPAAEYFEYDPRDIVNRAQSNNEEILRELIEGNEIWYCGQCMSCKTRCPRNNCPGLIISVLRQISQQTGAFIKSRYGRQQYLIWKNLSNNILNIGYCVHPSTIIPETHPEQGPVWEWIHENRDEVYQKFGTDLNKEGKGAMRKIADSDLQELHEIFNHSEAFELQGKIELFSRHKAFELGFINSDGEVDMVKYEQYLLEEDIDD